MSAEITPAVERARDVIGEQSDTEFPRAVAQAALADALDIEEMARAIYESALHNNAPGFPTWDEQTERIREYWRVYARAARTALLGADS